MIENKNKKGFSLIEVLVSLAVLGLIFAGAAGAFSSVQQAWRAQRNAIDLVQNSSWALERMVNEIRQGWSVSLLPPAASPPFATGRIISFYPYSGAFSRVWYWRGNGGNNGDVNIFYRGEGMTFTTANTFREELANLIVDNPGTSRIFFDPSPGLYTIELTVRPRPTLPAGRENHDYTLRTKVRVRN